MISTTFQQWKMENKRVFLRADLNVPLNNGTITNDFRLKSILPTIDYIRNHNGCIILATHIGRPTHNEPELSTQILIPWFQQHGYSITFVKDIATIPSMQTVPKHIFLLENLRFFPGKKKEILSLQNNLPTVHIFISMMLLA